MRVNIVDDFWGRVAIGGPDECWDWQAGGNSSGYGMFFYGGRMKYVHRLAWEFANKQIIPEGMYVLHSCDRKFCCNPAHLRIGTPADNMRDKVERGRSAKGEQHNMCKLTEANVREIREMAASGQTQSAIAERFGVMQPQISRIVTGRRWGHLYEGMEDHE